MRMVYAHKVATRTGHGIAIVRARSVAPAPMRPVAQTRDKVVCRALIGGGLSEYLVQQSYVVGKMLGSFVLLASTMNYIYYREQCERMTRDANDEKDAESEED